MCEELDVIKVKLHLMGFIHAYTNIIHIWRVTTN